MNELLEMVQQKTGLSPEMAQKAIDTVVGYIKGKVPGPMAAGLDSLLAGGGAAGGESGGGDMMDKAKSMMGGLGGVMGGKE